MSRLLLTGGAVLDGTGSPGFAADVLVDGGRIAQVRLDEPPADVLRIDCSGLVVAPGFIDSHSHSDLQVLEDRKEKLLQGVTAEVVGNCGFSAFPAGTDRRALQEFANGIFCGGDDWGWSSAQDYLAEASARSRHAGVYALTGHGSLRIAQAGLRQGPLPDSDLDAMERRLSECLEEGAAGFSTGLMYAPGASAPFEELERLCRVTARHDKIYATHMRNYFGGILDAIGEQIELARRTGCRLQISHLLIAGRKNWFLLPRVLEKIERARDEGIDVGFDCYPYVAGSTVLTQILPQWTLEGGLEELVARLENPTERARIAAETVDNLAWSWDDIFISAVASASNAGAVGRSIAELSQQKEKPAINVVLDLLREERGSVNMVSFNQSEENLRETMKHPLSMIISDGFYVKGRPHPRLFGTFPRFLGVYVRELELVSLPEGVRKITDAPARRFGIVGLGRIAEGYSADITVFDPGRIGSPADYENPELPPAGIHLVLRNGEVLFRKNATES